MGEVSSWSFHLLLGLVHDSRSSLRKKSLGKADVVVDRECVEELRRAEVARRVRVLMTDSLVALLLEELYFRYKMV